MPVSLIANGEVREGRHECQGGGPNWCGDILTIDVLIRSLTSASSVRGEPPPRPPRAFFGRNELIENVVSLAENLEPIALIGAGGIGKTSIALTVLHDHRIKKRFGNNRRFIRCDRFPPSLPNFLSRLSEAIGAGIDNPKDLASLQSFLSSREMVLVLDNAESILDPQGTNGREIYTTVQELSRFSNICLIITSRITTVPPHFERPVISTLSMESACGIFYSIYRSGGRSEVVSDLVRQLDFHALSITLLATTAFHNAWDYKRLVKEWDVQRSQALQTDYNESLAATIELSLASPTFRNLGLPARDLLGVIAFFPQGVDENNLDWLFPTIPNRKIIFDKLSLLSLTFRSDNFTTMLAPIRDHLRPKDPNSSPLLIVTKHRYFSRLSVNLSPEKPGFKEARWITTEDVNIEHLLDIFISLDMDSVIVWNAFANFLGHLYLHKPRYTILGSKVEGLADDHTFKPIYLIHLSRLPHVIGNHVEGKRLLSHALKLVRERKNGPQVARALFYLSEANRMLGLHKEGIQQAKEALAIYEQLGDTGMQAECWDNLGRLFLSDEQLDAAEKAELHTIDLLPEKGQEYRIFKSHRGLGHIYWAKREREKAIHHFEKALRIASTFEWRIELSRIHYDLAGLFWKDNESNDAHSHVNQAKLYADDDLHHLGRVMELKSMILHQQHRLEDAVTEALGTLEIYQKLGASVDIVRLKGWLQWLEQLIAGELPKTMPILIPVDPPFSADGTSKKSLFKSLMSYLHGPRS